MHIDKARKNDHTIESKGYIMNNKKGKISPL